MIGRNIKILRKDNNMTQLELAEKLEISPKTICSWETDRTEPNIVMIEKMCEIFHCLKTDIIGKDTIDYILVSNSNEKKLIETYRIADENTKEMIDRILMFTLIKKKEGDQNGNSKEN